jgi:tubulin-specific chaperone D
MLKSIDPNDVHGALLALAELAMAFQEVENTSDLGKERIKIFQSLANIPEKSSKMHRNDLFLEASCFVIASSVSPNGIELQRDYDGNGLKHPPPRWRAIFNAALEHRNQVVQEAAAKAVTALSMLRDCSNDVDR